MADYTILISCRHGDDKGRITSAEYSADYDEWNLPETPASKMLAGDALISNAHSGELHQPEQLVTDVRLQYQIACPRCGLSIVAREDDVKRVLDGFRHSNKFRLTLAEFAVMF